MTNYKPYLNLSNRLQMDNRYDKAWDIRAKNFGNKVAFFSPSFSPSKITERNVTGSFPSISVTGGSCSLNCKHCGGKILKSMISVSKPEELLQLSNVLSKREADGFLLSGGCSPQGSVPLERYIGVIKTIKKETNLSIVVHSGLIDYKMAEQLSDAGVDCVSIDIIGSDRTIRDIYGLNASIEDYRLSLAYLERFKINFMPHILIGLYYGQVKGEYDALKIISEFNPAALAFIIFTPIQGTLMEYSIPPSPSEISGILLYSRVHFPHTPITLGCVRPKRFHRVYTDILGLKSGVNGIAFPTAQTIRYAKEQGLKIEYSTYCCAFIGHHFS